MRAGFSKEQKCLGSKKQETKSDTFHYTSVGPAADFYDGRTLAQEPAQVIIPGWNPSKGNLQSNELHSRTQTDAYFVVLCSSTDGGQFT